MKGIPVSILVVAALHGALCGACALSVGDENRGRDVVSDTFLRDVADAGDVRADRHDVATDRPIGIADVVDAADVASEDGGVACDAGVSCGDACVDPQTDPANCGACGRTCTTAEHGSAACRAGACLVVCDAGYVPASGACVPDPAYRPLAPLSTSRTTTHRPTLRWANAAGTDGAHVELCRDRACTSVIAAFDASGTSARPPEPLAPGVVFWRLSDPGGDATRAGPTWEFRVGARDAAVDTSWGTMLDVNGDGFADVAIGAQGTDDNRGRVYVHHGSRDGVATEPAIVLLPPGNERLLLGCHIASAGDVNGDGYGDLLVGGWPGTLPGGRAYVYLGSPTGLAAEPALMLWVGGWDRGTFGCAGEGAGDVNGDGYGDVIVGGTSSGLSAGDAKVFFGGREGLSNRPALNLGGPWGPGGLYASDVGGAGDVDGDGYADLVVDDTLSEGGIGSLYVYAGGPAGPSPMPTWRLDYPYDAATQSLGLHIAAGLDVNGDGHADLAYTVASSYFGPGPEVRVLLGGSGGLARSPAATLRPPSSDVLYFGSYFGTCGDLNADGADDLVLWARPQLASSGRVYVFDGRSDATQLRVGRVLDWPSEDGRSQFGDGMASRGDVNGDGFDDLIVGKTSGAPTPNQVFIFNGGPGGAASSASETLMDEHDAETTFSFYGGSVTD